MSTGVFGIDRRLKLEEKIPVVTIFYREHLCSRRIDDSL